MAENGKCLIDSFGRPITYLRLSVTDRCNLRCLYCQSNAKDLYIPHDNILQYEELLRLVRIVCALGVKKVRLSGGEPFVRKGCDAFLLSLRKNFPDLDLRITSNGTLLGDFIPILQKVRIGALNLSLDSFDTETLTRITGRNVLSQILTNLDALRANDIRVKINAVALKGITDKELESFIYCAKTMGIDVRFIEFMPMGRDTLWSKERFCSVGLLQKMAESLVQLRRVESRVETDGPARMYEIVGSSGRLGFISAVTDHFCATCNRLRITSDGALRLCLFDDTEYALREKLRDSAISDQEIASFIQEACLKKKIGADILHAKRDIAVAKKVMRGIGG